MYQSPAVSALFPTLGYLVAIISILAMAILPRGKYLQNLVLNLFSVCLGSAVGLLMQWSSIQARLHTVGPAAPGAGGRAYNSSQSAVCAVWLFANIWFINTIRAKFPSFNLPSIVYSIISLISATYGPVMTDVRQSQAFITQILTAMLLALALATGVSLFIFPVSSRTVVMKQFAGAFGLMRKTVSLQKAYLQSIEREDMFTLEHVETSVGREDNAKTARKSHRHKEAVNDKKGKATLTKEEKNAQALKESIAQLRDLAGKVHGEIKFAKRDMAYGKLDATDIGDIFKLTRAIVIPM